MARPPAELEWALLGLREAGGGARGRGSAAPRKQMLPAPRKRPRASGAMAAVLWLGLRAAELGRLLRAAGAGRVSGAGRGLGRPGWRPGGGLGRAGGRARPGRAHPAPRVSVGPGPRGQERPCGPRAPR